MTTVPPPSRAVRVLVACVHAYQRWLSPLLGPRCRFAPTCSAYAVTALTRHGALRGVGLSLRRLGRCHPFHPGGHDPVPAARAAIGDDEGVGRGAPSPAGTRPGTARPRTSALHLGARS